VSLVNTHRKNQDMRIERLNQPILNFSEIHRSEWHNKNMFTNSKNLNLFLKNPGFMIRSQKHNKLILTLKILKNKYSPEEIYNLGLYVVKLIDEDNFSIFYEKIAKCYSPIGLTTA
jgi:hypothetical protein